MLEIMAVVAMGIVGVFFILIAAGLILDILDNRTKRGK